MKQERTSESEFQVATDNRGSRESKSRMKSVVKIFHRIPLNEMDVDENENTVYIFIPFNHFRRSLLFTRPPLVDVNTINEL
jgi:hypothetical protein